MPLLFGSSSSRSTSPEPDDNQDTDIDARENPPGWGSGQDEPEDVADGSGAEEHHYHTEVGDEEDSEVGGEILYDISEEDTSGSSSWSRGPVRNRGFARDGCPECVRLMAQWSKEVNDRDKIIAERDRDIRKLEKRIRDFVEQRRLHWIVSSVTSSMIVLHIVPLTNL
jgi:hypothetical protein